MKKITKIENQKKNTRKTRVAAYCRVSTDSDEQLISLEAQKEHYERLINARSDWTYAGLYYDEGITGTKKDKRPALMRMIKDCEDGRIDLIITKSISRFARNTTDCLELVRKLYALDIYIIFERENINTKDMEGELMLTILSSLAEEESVSISQNTKWSIQKRFENGTFKISYPPLGYRNNDGVMEIVPDEAETVKNIFEMFLAGKSTHVITDELNARCVKTKKGGRWTAHTVNGILKNEKYIGDVIFQKTWTDDNFNRHINYGEVDQYVFRDHHEAIISREDFEAVQELLARHFSEKGGTNDTDKYQNRYALSGKIKCGECGGTLKRKKNKRLYGIVITWSCGTHIEDKRKCSLKAVSERTIEVAFINMMNKLVFAHRQMLVPMLESMKGSDNKSGVGRINDLAVKMEENARKRDRLSLLLTQGILDSDIFNAENNTLLSEYQEMGDEIDAIKSDINSELKEINEMESLMKFTSRGEMLTDFREELLTEYVDHLVAHSQTRIEFVLKCGLSLTEDITNEPSAIRL